MRLRAITAALAAVSVLAAAPAVAQQVPPAAPSPTDSGNSPAAPDPHPPLGGRDAEGQPVGGADLLSRTDVLPAGAAALPKDLTAKSFTVFDLDTGAIIAARDPHGRYQAASIQKILTTVTLLPLLPGTRKVVVSHHAATIEGSHAGLVGGGTYTVDQLFEGLLLVSGNDCAEALAEAAGGRARTVALMNSTALGLGAVDTYVQTPSGLDGWQQLTSAYDMSLFLRAAMKDPRFASYDRMASATLPAQKAQGIGASTLLNQNEQFLTTKGALVAKTGYTDAAQHTFAGAIERGGHRYGVILMRAQRYPDDQWLQASRLVTWATRLAPGTKPVGELVTPTASAPKISNAAGTPSSHPAVAAAPRTTDESFPLWAWLWIAGLVIGGLVIARVTRRPRRA